MRRFKWIFLTGFIVCILLAVVLIAGSWFSTPQDKLTAEQREKREAILRATISTAPPEESYNAPGQGVTPPRRSPQETLRQEQPWSSYDGSNALPHNASFPKAGLSSLAFSSSSFNFSLHRLGVGNGNALLVIGGMLGDEPGSYYAAALLASRYTVTSGSLWVVPDANFASILEHSKGLYGNMDRKFVSLPDDDPDYDLVSRLKSIILDQEVGLVIALRDGLLPAGRRETTSGTVAGAQLRQMASRIEEEINRSGKFGDSYRIYGPPTPEQDKNANATLTFFAVHNGKPAFSASVASSLPLEQKICEHLKAMEAFMVQSGIRFERHFPLTPEGVAKALQSDLQCAIFKGKVVLPLENIRPVLTNIPFRKNGYPDVRSSIPLVSLIPEKQKQWRVAYANRTLTRITPAFMTFDDSLDSLEMLVDGTPRRVNLGETIPVAQSFAVTTPVGYRVNAVGVRKEKNNSETGRLLFREDFNPWDSLDENGTTFRVEIFKDNAFSGMVLVRFLENLGQPRIPVSPGPISPDSERARRAW